ncbi:unnamed protein product [Camellia sinensis]
MGRGKPEMEEKEEEIKNFACYVNSQVIKLRFSNLQHSLHRLLLLLPLERESVLETESMRDTSLDLFNPRTVMDFDYSPNGGRDSDFGFAFNDSNFSNRVLRVEIMADLPETQLDGEGCHRFADWARHRKRRREDVKKDNDLSNLSYLSHLNMSFNNLSRRIPTGNQLQTLNDPSMYIGNDGLCGAPLLNSCLNDKSSDGDHKHADESKVADETSFLWFYTSIGPGFLVGFLGVCGTLNFKKSWRYANFQFIENNYNWISINIAIKLAQLRRMFNKGKFGGCIYHPIGPSEESSIEIIGGLFDDGAQLG